MKRTDAKPPGKFSETPVTKVSLNAKQFKTTFIKITEAENSDCTAGNCVKLRVKVLMLVYISS